MTIHTSKVKSFVSQVTQLRNTIHQIPNKMSNNAAGEPPIPDLQFSDFPEDVQLCILSFLTPPEISSFACTSKRFLTLCRTDSKLCEDLIGSGSPPDRLTSEMYQYFANRTSPGGERAWRRQRRREREKQGNKKWESEHFVKIVNYCPTSSRPLQGLWKGICEDTNLDFYLVAYDDIGGIACRRIGDSCKPFSSYAPVFWTSNTTFIESPFSSEEEHIYETREHLLPPGDILCSEMESVSRILYINSSYDLVLPGLAGPTSVNPHQVEGRIWEYGDGTFGFGFLRDNHIIDLKHIAMDGCLLDAIQPL
ncbi:putative F-box domain-containing protein [Helianthus annuus]|nr:putative F-box domain-containing protein [Helianthus annuus]